ncbi:M48 family metalloprotease, partial [Acinetobacter baumannii]
WSKKEEVRIGQEVAAEVEKAYKLDPDPAVQQRVQLIGQRLVAVAGDKDFKYSFKVLQSKEINAFALPGGPIYVFRGLIDLVGDDDDMLAG